MTREELSAIINGARKDQVYMTHSGVQLTVKEHKFINALLREGDVGLAAQEAGYVIKEPTMPRYISKGRSLLKKPYIYEELQYRLDEIEKDAIADATEILNYFTKVMRGEVTDQFGLEAPLSERTNAAKELAKRIVDIPAKLTEEDRTFKINLNWERPKDDGASATTTDSTTEC